MSRSAPKLFITDRREETADYAGRLYDALAARWEERNVFMDVDPAPGGPRPSPPRAGHVRFHPNLLAVTGLEVSVSEAL